MQDFSGCFWFQKISYFASNSNKLLFKSPKLLLQGLPWCFWNHWSSSFSIMDRTNCWERATEPEPGVRADVADLRLICMQLRLYSTVDSKLPCQPNNDWQHWLEPTKVRPIVPGVPCNPPLPWFLRIFPFCWCWGVFWLYRGLGS